MGVKPIREKVLIKRLEAQETTKGGIIIPDSAKEKPQEGKVVAVGNGRFLEDGSVKPLEVKKGDKILFSKYGGTEIEVEGKEIKILRESDILAKIVD